MTDLYNFDSGKDTLGDGVMCYIHNSIMVTKTNKSKILNISEIEYLLLRLKTNKKYPTLFCVVYKPHKENSLSDFFEIINENNIGCDNVIIVGDVNSHL